jgi:surfactin synthase thioesterase subunit
MAAGSAQPRWFLRRPNPEAKARLFCFPYSGCGATMYQRWPRQIGDVEVCLVQPPARQNRIRDPHYQTYEELAKSLLEFLPPYLDRPFAFFGHCGGALPGLEVSRQLRAAGLPTPKRLFISSQVAPQDGPYGRLLLLDRDGLGEELARIIRNLGGQPTGALIELGLDLLVADIDANKKYAPGRIELDCGITVFGWTDDVEIPMSLMGGWSDNAADVRHVLLDGDHFEFLKGPSALFDEITRDLSPVPVAD